MLRYKTETRPGLVTLYDILPGNWAGLFLQPRNPHGALLESSPTVYIYVPEENARSTDSNVIMIGRPRVDPSNNCLDYCVATETTASPVLVPSLFVHVTMSGLPIFSGEQKSWNFRTFSRQFTIFGFQTTPKYVLLYFPVIGHTNEAHDDDDGRSPLCESKLVDSLIKIRQRDAWLVNVQMFSPFSYNSRIYRTYLFLRTRKIFQDFQELQQNGMPAMG